MFGDATALYERARNWTVGSDPGLLRLRMATRTTGALATALLALFLLTKATGQPLTVALLGVLISMMSARSVNEPDPRRQRITMALLPLPTALAITAAALLSPHPVIADAGFVLGGVHRGSTSAGSAHAEPRWGWSPSCPTSSRCICGRSSPSCRG